MNLYEAVYARKSVRCFAKEAVSGKTIESIRKFYQEMEGLFGGIETELVILENRKEKRSFMGFASVTMQYGTAIPKDVLSTNSAKSFTRKIITLQRMKHFRK